MKTRPKKPLSMRTKLILAMSAIAAVLSVSSAVSIIEYGKMSDYVSRSLQEDMERGSAAENLADAARKYNLRVLSCVGRADSLKFLNFDRIAALAECDSAAVQLAARSRGALADTVLTRYRAYARQSSELDSVIVSNFADAREWFFEGLQPTYNSLIHSIQLYKADINTHLMISADDFQDGFYRGIMPGIVITATGLLLIFLLLFFLLTYYVDPLRKMLSQLDAYNKDGIKKYNVDFDGDDEVSSLNANIRDLADENNQLKRKLRAMRKEQE